MEPGGDGSNTNTNTGPGNGSLGAWDRPAREPQAWELAVGSTA